MTSVVAVREEVVMRTFTARLHITGKGVLPRLYRELLQTTITAAGVAVQKILAALKTAIRVARDDDGRLTVVDVVFQCQPRDVGRAILNAAKPRRLAPTDKGPKEQARPQYRNSYHLETFDQTTGLLCFRVAEVFHWLGTRGEVKDKWLRGLHMIDSKIFQQVINSWLKPELSAVPSTLRAGVCQQAAQQFLSHVGLLDEASQTTTAFPSLAERDPDRRLHQWQANLEVLARSATPFAYLQVRQLFPGRYTDDDPRGDRLVNVDPDWLSFMTSPFPGTLPLNFVSSDAVVLYERTWQIERRGKKPLTQQRLYAALPIIVGEVEPKVRWWHKHLTEFQPLPVWSDARLTTARGQPKDLALIPLEYDPGKRSGEPSRFRRAFTGYSNRRVNWALLTQNRVRRGRERGQPQWLLHFATSRTVAVATRPKVLGVHFGVTPVMWWALVDSSGILLEEGCIPGNEILTAGLQAKMHLEEEQMQQRWVGDRRSNEELQRRTYEIAHRIVRLAAEHNANLALEEVVWVDKRLGSSAANRRFSMWNFSQLLAVLQWLGLERQVNGQADPVRTIRRVSDYVLRYTCPVCGACRKAKQTHETASTWRQGETLTCRVCGFTGPVPDDHQAQLVARLGAERLV